ARGGDGAKAGVHVRCVGASRQNVLAESDVVDGAKLTCPTTGLLAFSATNTTPTTLYVHAVANINADPPILFMLPFAGEEPFAVPPGSVDVPLPRGFPIPRALGPISF